MQLTWLLINTAVLLGLISYLYKHMALKHIEYERHFSKPAAFAGEEVEMVERIANRKLLPLPWVRLESMMDQGLVFGAQSNLDIRGGERFQNHISLFSLLPFRQIVRRHRVLCAKRGYYRFESVTMTAGDPVGLIQPSVRFPLSLSFIVYPEVIPYDELPLPSHSWLGDLTVRRWIVEDPFLTAGTREYRSGDSLRSVNWKATARAGSLQVHKKDYTADHRLVVCLNLETHEKMWKTVIEPERIERAISYAASVVVYAMNRGIDVGFLCNGWQAEEPNTPIWIEAGGGQAHMEQLLASMAKLQLETVMTMPDLLDMERKSNPTDTDYFIISCHHGDKLREKAEELEQLGNGVEWMIVPEERGGRR